MVLEAWAAKRGLGAAKRLVSGNKATVIEVDAKSRAKDDAHFDLMRKFVAAEATLKGGAKSVDFEGQTITSTQGLIEKYTLLDQPNINRHVREGKKEAAKGSIMSRRVFFGGLVATAVTGYVGVTAGVDAFQRTVDQRVKVIEQYQKRMFDTAGKLKDAFFPFLLKLALSIKDHPLDFGGALLDGIIGDFADIFRNGSFAPDKLLTKLDGFIQQHPELAPDYKAFKDAFKQFEQDIEDAKKEFGDLGDPNIVEKQKQKFWNDLSENFKKSLKDAVTPPSLRQGGK